MEKREEAGAGLLSEISSANYCYKLCFVAVLSFVLSFENDSV
jgi:hypothetical protein